MDINHDKFVERFSRVAEVFGGDNTDGKGAESDADDVETAVETSNPACWPPSCSSRCS